MGEYNTAYRVLSEVLEKGNQMEQVRALNAIDYMDEGELMKESVADIIERTFLIKKLAPLSTIHLPSL